MVETYAGQDRTGQQEVKQEISIRPEDLLKDNNSEEARQNRDEFYNHSPIILRTCSDARITKPSNRVIYVSQIGAAGPKTPYDDLFNDERSSAIVNLTHFDGTRFSLGQLPEGCGGLSAKKAMMQDPKSEQGKSGLPRYIGSINFDDPVALSLYDAAKIAKHSSGKPVLSAIQDHVTGTVIPLAVIRGTLKITELPIEDMLQDQYDPNKIYRNGIPALSEDYLPAELREYMELNRDEVVRLKTRYPNFEQMLKVQNPDCVVITTEKMPASGRYPQIFGKPGSCFQIHIPRIKEGGFVKIQNQSVQTAVEQTQYPVGHFSKVHTVLIETGNLDESRRIARALLGNKWMIDWFNNQNQILIAEAYRSKTRIIEKFK